MQTITLVIEDESKTLDPSELADFLYLFRAVNVALTQLMLVEGSNDIRLPTEDEIRIYRARLGKLSPEKLDSFFDPHTNSDILQIIHITRQSPLEIVLSGCMLLLTLGVIFSGGKIQLNSRGVKAELPSFGNGLKHLREALGLDKTLQAGFGIRGTVIKLSKEEYEALVQRPKGQGGFQNFLSRLQNRVNKQTRELELSRNDLERIYRYKADPKKGGYQSRFKKIFGRHFPDDTEEALLDFP